MMGYCPACQKLVAIEPAPRDAFGRPRKRVIPHDAPTLRYPASSSLASPLCRGSRALI